MTLLRAKFNYKYRRQKKQKPRLKGDDVAAYEHLLAGTGVGFGYDPETNDLWFHTPVEGLDIEFDGLDTGGQVIRFWLQWVICRSGGREGPPATMALPSKGKACMLYVQAVMYTLKVGQSFTVQGGDPHNADAPDCEFQCALFHELRAMLGVSFALEDESRLNDGNPQFTLTRLEDTEPDPRWRCGDAPLSVEMADQLMMAISFVKPPRQIMLRCESSSDYHIAAMVRCMRQDGMDDIGSSWRRNRRQGW